MITKHVGISVRQINRALGRLRRTLTNEKPLRSSLRAARADLADAMDQLIEAERKLRTPAKAKRASKAKAAQPLA